MRILEQYMECMKKGDNIGLADLFNEKGILHDTSFLKLNKDIMHLEGKMAIEMMFHHRFGFNGGRFLLQIRYIRQMTTYVILLNTATALYR